eukprot:4962973-Pyramimonas_sp.AAC.1
MPAARTNRARVSGEEAHQEPVHDGDAHSLAVAREVAQDVFKSGLRAESLCLSAQHRTSHSRA